MQLKCKFHRKEIIERICASSRWKMEPALCWQCMVDQSDHVKEHKENTVKVEDFIGRISKEFQSITEIRRKDSKYAFPDYVKLVNESEYTIQNYKYVIENRKIWVTDVIQKVVNEFSAQCAQLQENLFNQFDEKGKQFEDQADFIKSCIELRYGLVPLPDETEITEKLQQMADNDEDCNPYIRDLKDMLLPPLDLEKNLAFQESLSVVHRLRELSEQLQKQMEDKEEAAKHSDQEEDHNYGDPLCSEIMNQAKEQCAVLIDEVKMAIACRDPILSSQNPEAMENIDDSIQNNPIEPQIQEMDSSRRRSTYAKKLYDTNSLKEDNKNNPFLSQDLSQKKMSNGHQMDYSPNKMIASDEITFESKVKTQQSKGITSILQISTDCYATGSKDKSISVTFMRSPHENFNLIGHSDQVTALCLFQGKLLISGGGNLDSSLIVWSLSTRKQVHVMKGHQSGITCIADFHDGVSIVSGGYDNHAIIWNANEGEAVCALRKHTAMVSCVALTQRRDHLLTGSWDRTLGVWEIHYETRGRTVKGAKYLREIKAEGAVLCLTMLGDRQVAYGGTCNRVVLMDWQNGEIKRKLQTSQFGICEIICRDQMLIGLGGSDSTIRVWDLNDQREQEKIIHRDPTNIYINNNNTSPKMIELGHGKVAIINNNDKNAHFGIFKI